MSVEPGQFWLTNGELWFIIASNAEYDGAGEMWHVFRIPVLYDRDPSYQLMHDSIFVDILGAKLVA